MSDGGPRGKSRRRWWVVGAGVWRNACARQHDNQPCGATMTSSFHDDDERSHRTSIQRRLGRDTQGRESPRPSHTYRIWMTSVVVSRSRAPTASCGGDIGKPPPLHRNECLFDELQTHRTRTIGRGDGLPRIVSGVTPERRRSGQRIEV